MIQKLKELRIERGKTQKEIAVLLSVTQQTYSDYEVGRTNPTPDALVKLADFFEVSTDYLLGRENDFGAVNVKKELPGLSEEELQLVEDFRSLKPALREMLQATIQTWKGSKANAQERARRA